MQQLHHHNMVDGFKYCQFIAQNVILNSIYTISRKWSTYMVKSLLWNTTVIINKLSIEIHVMV